MSDDALATARALLSTAIELIRDDDEVAREVALIPRVRDAVLPPDHPLRTGEPSEAMHEAAMDVFRAHPGVWVNRDDEWLGLALRAALAVLREPTQRLT